MAPSLLRLTREQRIRLPGDFARIRTRGRRLTATHLILNWLISPELRCTRLGIIVSRRVGPSVVRSRTRRLLRESFRLHQHELGSTAELVLVARPSIAGKSFSQVESDFLAALGRAKLLKGEA